MNVVVDGVPFPADFSPVNAEKTPEFSEVWTGKWDNILNTVLAVEAVTDDGKARVVYAVAAGARHESIWGRHDAEIIGDTLTLFGSHRTISFRLSRTGRLRGILGDGLGFAILARQDADAMTAPSTDVRWTGGESVHLETPLIEENRRIRLETVIYRPRGKGPFPLAVVNHGSTGSGNDPEAAMETWENAWLADFLNEHGWIVAFPQRRGRGRSGGLYDEGFAEDRREGYTCDRKRSLAGADRALEDLEAAISALRRHPDVKPEPILLAGNSRGGILSVAYAGLHPEDISGVINFVGGWMGDACETADEINQTLFVKGARSLYRTLWLYGRDDSFYTIDHSRGNFDAFRRAGGKGSFVEATVPGENNGHWLMDVPTLWQTHVRNFLDALGE